MAVSISFAQSTPPATTAGPAPSGYRQPTVSEDMKGCKDPSLSAAEQKQCIDRVLGGTNGNNPRDCATQAKELQKAVGKFTGACSTVGLPPTAKECAEHIHDCTSKTKGDIDPKSDDDKLCPSAGADALKMQDDTQKVQDEMDKLKTDLGNVNDKISEANATSQEKISDLQTRMAKAQSDFTTAQAKMNTELTKQMSAMQKQTVAQMQQMQDQLDKLSIDAKGIPIQKQQARIKIYDEPVTNLRITCHQQAIKRVAELRDAALAKIAKSEYTIGGLSQMVRTMGMTDTQRDQQLAQRLELQCLNDGEYKMRVNLAWKEYKNQLSEMDRQTEAIRLQQSTLTKRITTAQQQQGKDMNDLQKEIYTEMQSAQQAFTTDMQAMQNQLMTSQNSAMTKVNALQSQAALKQSSIDQKQSYLTEKQKAARLAEAASHGAKYTSKEVGDLNTAFGEADGASQSVETACHCDGAKDDGAACDSADSFHLAATGSSFTPSNPVGKLDAGDTTMFPKDGSDPTTDAKTPTNGQGDQSARTPATQNSINEKSQNGSGTDTD